MPQNPLRRDNLQGHNGYKLSRHLQKKASLRQMSDTPGSLPNSTTGVLLMVKFQDLHQAIEGHSNVDPRDRRVDTIKTMDPVGLMVGSPSREISQ